VDPAGFELAFQAAKSHSITRAFVESTSAAKWFRKSSSRSHAKPWSSMSSVRLQESEVRVPASLDRFALVEPEPGDLHESEGVRRVFTKRGHDLAAV
jgi:hypothetical protein